MTNEEFSMNAWKVNTELLIAVQGEINGRVLQITLIDRSGKLDTTSNAEVVDRPIDLSQKRVQLYVAKPDGKHCIIDGRVVNAGKGVAEFVLSEQATAASGKAPCEVWVSEGDKNGLKVVGLTLDIQSSSAATITSTNEFLALTVATSEAKEAAALARSAAAEATLQAAGAQAARDTANTAAQNCVEKTNLCTATTRECVSATQDCQEAAEYACALRAPTVSVGLTETVEPGKPAQAVNVGTEKDPVINFQIPKGESGLYQMVNPITGKTARIDDVINSIYSYFIAPSLRPIAAEEYDDLTLPAENYDSRKLEAFEYDMKGKLLLIGGT